MQVLDDFLDAGEHAALLAAVASPAFPWRRTPILFPAPAGLDEAGNVQFVHGFLQHKPGFDFRSDRLPLVRPLLDRLAARAWIKVKLNRTLPRGQHLVYGWHVDTRRPGATTGVYYLNANDGYTAFEDGRRVDSVANRLVLFDARSRHSGASCTDAPQRLVLNLNFLPAPGGPGDFSRAAG
ncbi:MAG: 2OG-Fe(II) oxygenase [Comamonadaceae bacterium]|nr:MAG: 2OG-Fe(II) oxygenase [Comamonadaceae bacterium]